MRTNVNKQQNTRKNHHTQAKHKIIPPEQKQQQVTSATPTKTHKTPQHAQTYKMNTW